jgi:hypothetical protein
VNKNLNENTMILLAPLGAGDLIDRSVRFYRNNFWTFIWIAAPPIIIGTIISIGWTILGREIFSARRGVLKNWSVIIFSTGWTAF